jgi:hypothetical protein
VIGGCTTPPSNLALVPIQVRTRGGCPARPPARTLAGMNITSLAARRASRRLPRSPIAAMAVLVALTALVALAAGCSSAHPRSAAGSSGPAPGRAVVVWQQFVSCARSHGLPGLPDPTVDSQGVASFPGANAQNDWDHPTDVPAVQQACGPILDRLPGASPAPAPPDPAQFQLLLSFARCMRHGGITDWPDPNAKGQFPLDQHLQALGKRGVYPPLQRCEQANPSVRPLLHVIQGP